MRPQNRADDRYDLVAITLHWVMALGIIALAAIGLVMARVEIPPMRLFTLYQLHKSIGITILLAAVLRLVWRLGHRPPALPAMMGQAERRLAEGAHWLLYAFLHILPLTGWALVSASVYGIPTVLYGFLPWPHLPYFSTLADKAPVESALKLVHTYGAWALLLVVVGHAGAALRHHFVKRDDVLLRMLPRPRRSSDI